jgi:hypothetical protein
MDAQVGQMQYSERLGAEGEVSNQSESYRLPLNGEQVGAFWFQKALVEGAAAAYGFGDVPDCEELPLQNGFVSVSLERRESDQVKVTVEPEGGVFKEICAGGEIGGRPGFQDAVPATWDLVRLFKGMGPDEPFVFIFDGGKRTGNVFGALVSTEELKTRMQANGTVVLSEGGLTYSVSMWVGLYESMALQEQERKDAEVAGTAKPSKPATP